MDYGTLVIPKLFFFRFSVYPGCGWSRRPAYGGLKWSFAQSW